MHCGSYLYHVASFYTRLGEVCFHVAAVLFKVEAVVRLGYTSVVCTSRPCEWNQAFSKKVYMNIRTCDADSASMHMHTCFSYTCRFQQLEYVNIDFSKPKRVSANEVCTADYVQTITEVKQPSQDDMDSFFEKLATNSKSVALLSTVPKFCSEFVSAPTTEPNIPKCLGDLYSESNRHLTPEDLRVLCKHVADELVVTKSEALYLKLATRKQSASLEWFERRIGRIIVSIVYQVLHTNNDQPSSSLLRQICTGHNKVTAAPLEWGRKN